MSGELFQNSFHTSGDVLINGKRYRLCECIYQGTDSRIYTAFQTYGGRDPVGFFAVKVISCNRDSELWERALREIEAGLLMRRCRHAVRLLGYSVRQSGRHMDIFLLMEKLSCCTDLKPDTGEVLLMCADVCEALALLLRKGLVHGDVKPSNLFYHPVYGWQIGDFGSVGRAGEIAEYGSRGYCAPEVWRGEPCDSRADVYALGMTAYRLLSGGRLPFCPMPCDRMEDEAVYQAIERRMNGEPIPPIEGISSPINRVLLKMCAFRPENRYHNPREAGRECRRIWEDMH